MKNPLDIHGTFRETESAYSPNDPNGEALMHAMPVRRIAGATNGYRTFLSLRADDAIIAIDFSASTDENARLIVARASDRIGARVKSGWVSGGLLGDGSLAPQPS